MSHGRMPPPRYAHTIVCSGNAKKHSQLPDCSLVGCMTCSSPSRCPMYMLRKMLHNWKFLLTSDLLPKRIDDHENWMPFLAYVIILSRKSLLSAYPFGERLHFHGKCCAKATTEHVFEYITGLLYHYNNSTEPLPYRDSLT